MLQQGKHQLLLAHSGGTVNFKMLGHLGKFADFFLFKLYDVHQVFSSLSYYYLEVFSAAMAELLIRNKRYALSVNAFQHFNIIYLKAGGLSF